MQQVEGGDLLVVQRGGGSKPRSQLDTGFSGGPWWKGMEKVYISNFSVSSRDGLNSVLRGILMLL